MLDLDNVTTEELFEKYDDIKGYIKKRIEDAINEIISRKVGKSVYLSYNATNIVCKRIGSGRYYRIYDLVEGVRGLKQGEIIIRNVHGSIFDIKRLLRFNCHYYVKFDDKNTWQNA